MIVAPFVEGRDYDEYLDKINVIVYESITERNDDWLQVIAGITGSGKSTLMLHQYDSFANIGKFSPNINCVCFDKENLADSFDYNTKIPRGQRVVAYDEANVSKRDSVTKFNKALIDLYFSVRGLNIFHIWCNPSIDMLDKVFVGERIRSFILIGQKGNNGLRYYYYFRKTDLLKVLKKYENLKLDTLYKVRKKYSYYRGWFRVYNGVLRQEYDAKKESRMNEKVNEFKKAFGTSDRSDFLRPKVFREAVGISEFALTRYTRAMQSELVEGVDIIINPTGNKLYHKNLVEKYKDYAKSNSLKRKMGGYA